MRISWLVLWTSLSFLVFMGCASDDQQGQQEELEQGQEGQQGDEGYAEGDGAAGETDVNQFNELGDGGLDNLANAAVNEVGLEQAVPVDGGGISSNMDPSSRVVRYVVSDGTAVYSQPSADGAPVTTLGSGDVLLVTIPGDGWAQIAEGRFISEGSLSEQIIPRAPSGQAWTNTPPVPPEPVQQDLNANNLNNSENPFNQGDDLEGGLGGTGLNQQGTENFGNSEQLDQTELNNQVQNSGDQEYQNQNQDNQGNDQEYQQEDYDE